MRYLLYNSHGNTEGLPQYLGAFEIDDASDVVRYIEIGIDGRALRYDELHPADQYGQLPEGPIDHAEASQPCYGSLSEIDAAVFGTLWGKVIADNYHLGSTAL